MEGESKGGYFPSWHTTFAESLVSNPKFAAMMQEKINMKVDTAAIDQEIANYEKQLRQSYSVKSKLMEEIDSLDPDDRHYIKRKADLDDRLYKMYDRIEEIESQLTIYLHSVKSALPFGSTDFNTEIFPEPFRNLTVWKDFSSGADRGRSSSPAPAGRTP